MEYNNLARTRCN